ncbi:hypothetical protein FHU41_002885 [Psychromicrobium silvestre]|uniref:Uncharacterized protein n=1 Tax=Psychromicrobium silvestre TaxID=1645614 RepID=A0A7Y9S8P4_9MICC|nr:hypothetical protein [Psychromicrobium silvestre]NYE96635.1 hypothetical protein [Psychromicrobium silvestre]
MERFFRAMRPWVIGLSIVVSLAMMASGIYSIIGALDSHRTIRPFPFPGYFGLVISFTVFWLYWVGKKPYIDTKSPYWLWERGAESVGKVSIPLPTEQVYRAVAKVLDEDPKVRIHEQHPDWLWASLGKNYDRAGYWLAAYLAPNQQGTTLTLGIWSKNYIAYNFGRNKRKVARLLDSLTAELAPAPLKPEIYLHNAVVSTAPAAISAQQPQ